MPVSSQAAQGSMSLSLCSTQHQENHPQQKAIPRFILFSQRSLMAASISRRAVTFERKESISPAFSQQENFYVYQLSRGILFSTAPIDLPGSYCRCPFAISLGTFNGYHDRHDPNNRRNPEQNQHRFDEHYVGLRPAGGHRSTTAVARRPSCLLLLQRAPRARPLMAMLLADSASGSTPVHSPGPRRHDRCAPLGFKINLSKDRAERAVRHVR